MRVLGVDVPAPLMVAWRSWLAPDPQPFYLSDAEDLGIDARPAGVMTAELRDTFQLWNVDTGLNTVWLREQDFASLPRSTRAALVRAQASHSRGAVPSVRAWADVLDPQVLRRQADGHRFVWWPSLLRDDLAEAVLERVVTGDRQKSRHAEITDAIWRGCAALLPAARDLAGTFPPGSGANCFGTVMAACGVEAAADTWMLQAPFETWLSASAQEGGRDADPGTVLVWRDKERLAKHAAITIGDGWGLEKPSQEWSTPRTVLRASDIIRTTRTPGLRLTRYRLKP